MKRGEVKQLHNKTQEELRAMLMETKKALFRAKMDLAQNKLKNTHLLSRLKDDVARILTLLQIKEVKNA